MSIKEGSFGAVLYTSSKGRRECTAYITLRWLVRQGMEGTPNTPKYPESWWCPRWMPSLPQVITTLRRSEMLMQRQRPVMYMEPARTHHNGRLVRIEPRQLLPSQQLARQRQGLAVDPSEGNIRSFVRRRMTGHPGQSPAPHLLLSACHCSRQPRPLNPEVRIHLPSKLGGVLHKIRYLVTGRLDVGFAEIAWHSS